MQTRPKSPKEIVQEALAAFDLEFNELVSEFKPRLESAIKLDGVNSDAFRILEEIRQIKFERNILGMKLSDREAAHRLIGRIKNIRLKVIRILG